MLLLFAKGKAVKEVALTLAINVDDHVIIRWKEHLGDPRMQYYAIREHEFHGTLYRGQTYLNYNTNPRMETYAIFSSRRVQL